MNPAGVTNNNKLYMGDKNFWPLTLNRSFDDLILGILKIKDKSDFSNDNITNILYLVRLNKQEIINDYNNLIGNKNQRIINSKIENGSHMHMIGDQIYIGKNVSLNHILINSSEGPVWIGDNVTIMEGTTIKGPAAILDGAVIKMGAKIYPGTTIGPYSKIGGEISNSIVLGYSNKPHDGFLGDSYIGEWCNLGAGTNISNLKNNYSNVKLWNYSKEKFIDTGMQFCGLFMGDHSKCGINTMFNTGSVVGIFCNIFGSGYPRNFIPSFSWGGSHGFKEHTFKEALMTAKIVTARRDCQITVHNIDNFKQIFEDTKKYRKK